MSELKDSDYYGTPPELFEELNLKYGPFDLDVCAKAETAKCSHYFSLDKQQDALLLPWTKHSKTMRAWMNPPYSQQKIWVEKAWQESRKGIRVCCLLKVCTGTAYWHKYVWDKTKLQPRPGVIIDFLEQRPKFWLGGAPTPGTGKYDIVVVVFKGLRK